MKGVLGEQEETEVTHPGINTIIWHLDQKRVNLFLLALLALLLAASSRGAVVGSSGLFLMDDEARVALSRVPLETSEVGVLTHIVVLLYHSSG